MNKIETYYESGDLSLRDVQLEVMIKGLSWAAVVNGQSCDVSQRRPLNFKNIARSTQFSYDRRTIKQWSPTLAKLSAFEAGERPTSFPLL